MFFLKFTSPVNHEKNCGEMYYVKRVYIYTISTNSLWVDKSQTFVTLCLMKWWVCLCSW